MLCVIESVDVCILILILNLFESVDELISFVDVGCFDVCNVVGYLLEGLCVVGGVVEHVVCEVVFV